MGFWEDATPATKGTIVLGAVLIVYFGLASTLGFWPYNNPNGPAEGVRGVPATAAP